MPAAEIDPFHPVEISARISLQPLPAFAPARRILLAQCVEMQPLDAFQQICPEIVLRHAQPGAAATGIIDAVLLGGIFRIDPDAALLYRLQAPGPCTFPTGRRN